MVRDTIIDWQIKQGAIFQKWSCPVVGETTDGWLNDMNGFHVKAEHVMQALESATSGSIAEGNVGGGTGMITFEFKGGIGTSSRKIPEKLGGWTIGVLVQANFGRRFQLTISGVPVGKHLLSDAPFTNGKNPLNREEGSLIVIIATDAPLLPHQLKRLAKRASLGMARTGSLGGNGSGDIYLAFSTANPGAANPSSGIAQIQTLSNEHLDPILFSCVHATEEAIVNSMIAAETMTGRDGLTIKALPHNELQSILNHYGR
jgi:L-aminopeptidase/D-esterase-like protein